MKDRNQEVRRRIEDESSMFRGSRRMDVALQIRERMLAKGLRNTDVAARLGVTEQNISRMLRGNQNLRLDTLYELADALEEPLTIMLGANAPASVASAVESLDPDDQQTGVAPREASGLRSANRDEWEALRLSADVVSLDAYRKFKPDLGGEGARRFARSMSGFGITEADERMCG